MQFQNLLYKGQSMKRWLSSLVIFLTKCPPARGDCQRRQLTLQLVVCKNGLVCQFPQKEFDLFWVLVRPYSFGRTCKNISAIVVLEGNPRFCGEDPRWFTFTIPFIISLLRSVICEYKRQIDPLINFQLVCRV